jgi:uncharacterized protein (TIGR02594 family)
MTTLALGDRGPEVERLQKSLISKLHPHLQLATDSVFGPDTYAAVRLFQASIGLSIDGIVTPEVWEALERKVPLHHKIYAPVPVNVRGAPWMAVALQEKGQREFAGRLRNNPRILQYHATTTLAASTDETPWCSAFVKWCLLQVGIAGTKSAAARSWVDWGKASAAVPGAITVLHDHRAPRASGYHVGILVQDTGFHYFLLGGNQHDEVRVSKYPKSSWRVVAHRWPAQ